VPVEQLGPEEELCSDAPTLKEPKIFLMLELLHFLHLSLVFSELTPTNKSNFSPQSLHT